ncbi:MAG: lamin tail domain-containing protein, partial [Myxococcota bacterium]
MAALAACSDGGTVDPCLDVRCVTAPPPTCDGDLKVVYHAVGSCSSDATGATHCDYPLAQRQSCAELGGKVCKDGQCVAPEVVPCAGVTCLTPPPPDCDGNTAQIYAASGSCDPNVGENGACVYPIDATLDCTPSHKVCRVGACVDPSSTPCDPNPCDVPPQGSCSGNVPDVPVALGQCTAGTSGAECAFQTTSGTACVGATPECRFGRCAAGLGAPTAAGDLVISEVMKNPNLAGDQSEWFELYNATDLALELDGCTVSDDGGDLWTAPDADLFVPAGGYVVLGKSDVRADNGGFVPDATYDGVTLANSADELVITCGGTVIDRLAWATDWPTGTGRAMSLDPSKLDAADN